MTPYALRTSYVPAAPATTPYDVPKKETAR